jgi:nucleoside 2-deoxyribosyltransferase
MKSPVHLYLAGFDVFRPDAAEHGLALQQLCRQHGFVGHYPTDPSPPPDRQGPALAHWILQSNLAAIRQADAVLANLNPFRGLEPDSGTAFEVGFAHALGKPVWAYVDDDRPLPRRVPHELHSDGRRFDAQGYQVEDFGLPLNLMLACSVRLVRGDAAACLQAMAEARGTRSS